MVIQNSKLSRAGQKIFGLLNLPVWPRPFPNMGKIISREPNDLESSFSHQNVHNKSSWFDIPEKMTTPSCIVFSQLKET